MKILTSFIVALLSVLVIGTALAGDFRPAVVYDTDDKFDKGFNEGVWNGLRKFSAETGIRVEELLIADRSRREQAMRNLVEGGATMVIAVGFTQAEAIDAVAADYPDRQFAIIDVSWLDRPNLRQYAFREHEGSYLVGVAAALASRTGKVGFVGGMDIPLIRRFHCGYLQGAKAARGDIEVLQAMTGTTPAAWSDPARAAELAQGQIRRGADVIYHAAGGSGIGVIRAAAEAGRLSIGVDSNQNGLAPGSVLTSMLKRVDVAAYQTLNDGLNGNFTAGVVSLGLAEGGIDWAQDEHNAALLTASLKAAVEQARADIVAGKIVVHDYMQDGACPG